jgi:WS/DGAT/MGAT family acyltransferase
VRDAPDLFVAEKSPLLYKMKSLSGLDAAFLYLETPRTPLHVAGLSIFAPASGGVLDFATFRSHLAARLTRVRTYRERLVMVPLGLGHPYWIEDPDFALDRHLHAVRLPAPGGWAEMRSLMAHVISRPLDRSRPLWEMTYIEGLDTVAGAPPGSTALICKVHHAAIDGASGGVMLGALLDETAEPGGEPAPVPWHPPRVPDGLTVLSHTAAGYLRWPRKAADLLATTVAAAVKYPFVPRVNEGEALPWLYGAPSTPLNAPVSAQRVWDSVTLSLARVRAMKALMPGATVNDVVLAVTAGALRRYLLRKHALPDRGLIAMVPVSLRQDEARSAMGNQVSAILVDLATDEAEPVRRLQRIRAGAGQSKAYHHVLDMAGLLEAFQFVPFGLASLGVRLYTGSRVTEKINPIFNCIITNVPGVQTPLYLHGAQMIANLGLTPIYDGVGLAITIFSYAGALTISANTCRTLMPDVALFLRDIEAAVEELANALAACGNAQVDEQGSLPGS